jgi:hypothetical protein
LAEEGGEGGRGAESYERKKAWPSINHFQSSPEADIVIPHTLASEGVKGALSETIKNTSKFFYVDSDPGSEIEKFGYRIRKKYSGSATLYLVMHLATDGCTLVYR